jgi:beta-glucanase (GH16 family)
MANEAFMNLVRTAQIVVGVSVMAGLALAASRPEEPEHDEPRPPPIEVRCEPVFVEDFRNLSVSAWGPGTRWIAHTPWNGDFGDAKFTDPSPGFPFRTGPDGLVIEARKVNGEWRSGLLSSTDAKGRGFAQRYGYFEIDAKVPRGPGVWPAFWLATRQGAKISVEVDILEYYGHNPEGYQAALHVWRDGKHVHEPAVVPIDSRKGPLADGFHTWAANVERDWISFYLDRQEVWRVKTPAEHTGELGVLLNLALGSGWPIDKTPDPSEFLVRSVKVYPPLSQCRG